ncbi:MAG: UDP-N-acetylmuramoyl-tripeptide--D-alanyl-D-alanine ligase [Acidobacteria bacterium]|nr:UDP-N-acetylmuramoyl-tripeptide--D-alanyl-D-alanine ligase [Acidobacteriota bacterium]
MADHGSARVRAGELALAAGGRLVAGLPDVELGDISIDSRRIRPGDVFLAIRGNRLDGHDFIAEAVGRGAAGVIVSDTAAAPVTGASRVAPATIVVGDTTHALQSIARDVRRRSGAKVVAITGSVGKTTTKELTAAFIGTRHDVLRNEGNLNNHIGLPLSLLALRRRPEVAVVELGMNHAGEIHTLVGIAEPNVRVWTNVAEVHAESFASIEGIADAKAEILDGATARDHLVVNAGDTLAMERIGGFPGGVTTFGVDTQADVRATDVEDRGIDGMRAAVETPAGAGGLSTRLLGAGQVANVVAAIAVALLFQVPVEAMLREAAAFAPPPRRGEVIRLAQGVTVVDDSYNSNPAALEQALRSLGSDKGHRRRVAVLGEMLELGPRARLLHRACGRLAVEAGFDVLVAVGGPAAEALAEGARAAGLDAGHAVTCGTSEDAASLTAALVRAGDLVLVKGSRGVRVDRVADRLKAERA